LIPDACALPDISSVCAWKRSDALETLLNRRDLHHRLVDGTDYP
jgi:hypothetical protein